MLSRPLSSVKTLAWRWQDFKCFHDTQNIGLVVCIILVQSILLVSGTSHWCCLMLSQIGLNIQASVRRGCSWFKYTFLVFVISRTIANDVAWPSEPVSVSITIVVGDALSNTRCNATRHVPIGLAKVVPAAHECLYGSNDCTLSDLEDLGNDKDI